MDTRGGQREIVLSKKAKRNGPRPIRVQVTHIDGRLYRIEVAQTLEHGEYSLSPSDRTRHSASAFISWGLPERLLQSAVPSMFIGLEHTAIASPDPAGLAAWYVDHSDSDQLSVRRVLLREGPNGSMLEIIPAEGDRGANQPKTPGIRHLAIAVEDFDEAPPALREQGVQFLGEPYENQGNRLVFFTDRDGNILHLIKRAAAVAVNR